MSGGGDQCRPRPLTHSPLAPRPPRTQTHTKKHTDAMPAQDNAKQWQPGEDALFEQLVNDPQMRDVRGNHSWKKIAQKMRDAEFDRSEGSIRNHYQRREEMRARAANGEAKNLCGVCGQVKMGHVCPGPPEKMRAPAPARPRALSPPIGAAAKQTPLLAEHAPAPPPMSAAAHASAPPACPPSPAFNGQPASALGGMVVDDVVEAFLAQMNGGATLTLAPRDWRPDRLAQMMGSEFLGQFAERPAFNENGTPDGSANGGGFY